MGSSSFRIISKHIIPNSIQSLIVVASIDLGTVILFAAGMSFIGLGAPPGTAEWGALLNASRDWISQGKWWTFLFPGAAIFLYVMGWNLIGDAFGDLLDPRVQR
jgi:peptide/nickel transport system permease protein